MVARRVSTHPETRLALVGYLSARERGDGDRAAAARLARRHLPGRAASYAIERVVVTELEMSEPAAERLIEECKAEGLALTFLPQHYGLLGPGIELNRLAELPVLDFRFSDPPRSTMAMKRAMDIVVSGLLLVLLSPLLLRRRALRSCSTPGGRSSSASAAPARTASRSRWSSSAPWSPTPSSGCRSWSTSRTSTSRPSRSPTTRG